jgi:hypothetical protein
LQHTPSFKSSYEQPKSSCKALEEVTKWLRSLSGRTSGSVTLTVSGLRCRRPTGVAARLAPRTPKREGDAFPGRVPRSELPQSTGPGRTRPGPACPPRSAHFRCHRLRIAPWAVTASDQGCNEYTAAPTAGSPLAESVSTLSTQADIVGLSCFQ